MHLGSVLNELLKLDQFLPKEDLFGIIKSTITLFVLSILNGFLDYSLEAEDNELFVKVGFALSRYGELLVSLFKLVQPFHQKNSKCDSQSWTICNVPNRMSVTLFQQLNQQLLLFSQFLRLNPHDLEEFLPGYDVPLIGIADWAVFSLAVVFMGLEVAVDEYFCPFV